MGPRGLNLNLQALLSFGNQESQWALVWYVIGTHSQWKYVPYVGAYGPQGQIFKYKGPSFFLETKAATWL